jgi:hypothetical protein
MNSISMKIVKQKDTRKGEEDRRQYADIAI